MGKTTTLLLLCCLAVAINSSLLPAIGEPRNAALNYWDISNDYPFLFPDNRQILFLGERGNEKKLYLLNIGNGSQPKEIPNTLGVIGGSPFFALSPDGKQICFLRIENDEREGYLCLINLDGSNLKKLTNTKALYEGISWSPDQKWIVFKKNVYNPRLEEILLVDTTNGACSKIGQGSYPSWSRDSKMIAFEEDILKGISIVNQAVNIFNIEKRTQNTYLRKKPWGGIIIGVCWSADGKKVFIFTKRDIYSINAGNSLNRNLTLYTEDTDEPTNPLLSPDGKEFVYVRSNDIWIMDINRYRSNSSKGTYLGRSRYGHIEDLSGYGGRLITNLTGARSEKKIFDNRPTWSPDGKQIVFTRDFDIWIMNADGSGQRQLTFDRFNAVEKYKKEAKRIAPKTAD